MAVGAGWEGAVVLVGGVGVDPGAVPVVVVVAAVGGNVCPSVPRLSNDKT